MRDTTSRERQSRLKLDVKHRSSEKVSRAEFMLSVADGNKASHNVRRYECEYKRHAIVLRSNRTPAALPRYRSGRLRAGRLLAKRDLIQLGFQFQYQRCGVAS